MTLKISKQRLLIVEGRDEEQFFDAAMNYLGIASVQILGIGGKTRLTSNLKALIRDPAFSSVKTLAVVRDADQFNETTVVDAQQTQRTAAQAAFLSVCTSLEIAHLRTPPMHGCFSDSAPQVGVYIMPDGNSDGMLETLCMWSVRTNREWPCVEAFLACLKSLGMQSRNVAKASAQCWLASKPDPGKRVGEAAQAGYWPWGAECFSPLWQFLRVLSGG
jgi:hypothetical protein